MSTEVIIALCVACYLSGAATALLVAIRVVKREVAAAAAKPQ